MVVIRLSRAGAKKRPFYHIVVTDKRNSRDGNFIKRVGYFNPSPAGKDIPLHIDMVAVNEWIAKGAQASDRVKSLLKSYKAQAKTETQAA